MCSKHLDVLRGPSRRGGWGWNNPGGVGRGRRGFLSLKIKIKVSKFPSSKFQIFKFQSSEVSKFQRRKVSKLQSSQFSRVLRNSNHWRSSPRKGHSRHDEKWGAEVLDPVDRGLLVAKAIRTIVPSTLAVFKPYKIFEDGPPDHDWSKDIFMIFWESVLIPKGALLILLEPYIETMGENHLGVFCVFS